MADYGVVTRVEALESGLSSSQISRKLKRVERGVYCLPDHPESREQRWLAICRSLGPEAVLSHRAAARLHHLDGMEDDRAEVTLPLTARRRGRRGTLLHFSRSLAPEDVTWVDGIPVTRVPRTLLDLAGCVSEETLAMAFECAWRNGNVWDFLDEVTLCVRKAGHGRPGARALRRLLADARARGQPFRSALEVLLWRLMKRSRLPRPRPGLQVCDAAGRMEIDFAYPERGLAIETLGVQFHRDTFENDSKRTERLGQLGWTVVPVTWRQVQREPVGLIRRLTAILGRRRHAPAMDRPLDR